MGRSITAALSGSIAALSVVASRVLGTSTIASSGQPAITSALGCVIDSTGAVLFNKAKDTQHGQASTTKMMTAYVACQHAATSDVATMPADLATGGSESYPGESNAGLVTGERLTCAQLLTAMLYPSGGDAARMLAACVGGLYLGGTDQDLSGQAAFVAEMNAQAAALGMTNTHYVNPSGNAQYPGGTTVITTHYSSTYDMCLLVRAAMTQSGAMADALRAAHLLGGANVTTSVTTRHYDNLAAAIGIGNYPGCTGSKGGSWGPTPSIHAHLGSATRGSHTVYFAVMDTNNATGPDVPIMLDYAFSQLNENASATATVQDGNTLITGGWGRSGSFPLNYSEAYAAISTAANATLTVTLTGYAFRVFMPKSTNRGIVAVYFDNVFQTNVDLYNAGGFQTAASIGPIWSTTLTSRGAHTIKLVNTGTKNASSTGTTLDLDYITYDDQLGPLSLPITAGMPSFLTLTSGTTGTVPFTVGQVFEQGAVTTGNYATLTNSSSYQIKPTNHWADGSVKHAIISGLTATTAATPKAHGFSTTTTPPSGTALTTSDIPAGFVITETSIAIAGYTTATLNTAATPWKTVVSGPVMSNWIYRVPFGADPDLVGWFDVRLYSNGSVSVWPWVENGGLRTSTGDTPIQPVVGQITVKVGGSVVYTGLPRTHELNGGARVAGAGMSIVSDPDLLASTIATLATGWTLGTTTAGHYASLVKGSEVTVTSTAALPDTLSGLTIIASPTTVGGDYYSLDYAQAGTYSAGTWTIPIILRSATVAASGTVRLRARVYKGTNAWGTDAVELTTSTLVSNTVGPLSTTVDTVCTLTWSGAPAFTLLGGTYGQYLFIQIAVEIVTASASGSADAVIRVNGSTQRMTTPAFCPPIFPNTSVPLVAGTAFEGYWYGIADPQVIPQHDTEYVMATKLTPPYDTSLPPTAAAYVTTPSGGLWSDSNFLRQPPQLLEPGQFANQRLANAPSGSGQGDTGYSPTIGVLPGYDGLYLASHGDARAWKIMHANHQAHGLFPCFYTERIAGKVGNVPLLSDHPTLDDSNLPTQNGGSAPTPWSTYNATVGAAHQPGQGYFPYLMTGRYWYLRTLQQLNYRNLVWSRSAASPYTAADGVFITTGGEAERATAWEWRTQGCTIAASPDGDPVQAENRIYFANSMDVSTGRFVTGVYSSGVWKNNLGHLGVTQSSGHSPYDPGNGYVIIAPWMHGFVIDSLAFTSDLDLQLPGAGNANHVASRDHGYKWITHLFGAGDGTDWPFPLAGAYNLIIGTGGGGPGTDTVPPAYFPDWSTMVATNMALYDGTFGAAGFVYNPPPPHCVGARVTLNLNPRGILCNSFPALVYAADHNAPGAKAAYERLVASANWVTSTQNQFRDNPLWGMAPRFDTITSYPPEVPAVGFITNVGTLNGAKTISAVAPAAGPWTGNSGISSLWEICPVVYAPSVGSKGSYYTMGGGHGGYYGNEVYRFDVNDLTWDRITSPDPLTYGVSGGAFGDGSYGEIWADAAFTTTKHDQPGSGHNPYAVWIPPGLVQESGTNGSFVSVAAWATSPNGNNSGGTHTLSPLTTTNNWSSSPPTWQRLKDTSGTEYPLCSGARQTSAPFPFLIWDKGAVYDPLRNYLWAANSSLVAGTLWATKLANPKLATPGLTTNTAMMNITGGTFLYLPEFDYLFSHRFVFSTNVNTIVCVNPTSLVRTLPTQSGTPPNTLESPVTGAGGGGCWCPDYPTGPAFVYYSGGPDKTEYPTTSVPFPFHDLTVWVAQPMLSDGVTYTGDPTGNWHWTKVAMQLTTAGDYPHAQDWRASDAATYGPYISQDGVGHEKRFVYCRPLKAFLWFPDVRSPFSIFKVF